MIGNIFHWKYIQTYEFVIVADLHIIKELSIVLEVCALLKLHYTAVRSKRLMCYLICFLDFAGNNQLQLSETGGVDASICQR